MKFILTADWHICGEQPPCRVGDWIEIQRKNVEFVINYSNTKRIPIYHTGDIFDRARSATVAINMLISCISKAEYGFYLLAGNHDLLEHSWDNKDASSIGILYNSGVAKELHDANNLWCGYPFNKDEEANTYPEIRFIHKLVFPDEASRPIKECGITATELLEAFPNEDWICTGDYHHSFHYKEGKRHVVNPGCLNIQKSDMADYKPKFAVVDTQSGKVEWVNVPFDEDSIDISYNVTKKEREERFSVFVEKIGSGKKAVSLSFWDNLDTEAARVSDRIAKIITKVKTEVQNVREGK